MSTLRLTPFASDLLLRNLSVLAQIDPLTADVLHSEKADFFFRNLATSPDLYHIELMHRGVYVPLPQVQLPEWSAFTTLDTQFDSARHKLRIGVGTGLELLTDLSESTAKVTVIEKHPAWIRYFLSRFDVTALLNSGRLRICFPLPFLFETTNKEHVLEAEWSVSEHSQHLYHDLVQFTQPPFETKSHLDVIIDGALIIDDLWHTLHESGHSALIFAPNLYPNAYVKRVLSHPAVQRIWTINRMDSLPDLLTEAPAPILMHETDPDLSEIPKAPAKSNVFMFSYRQSRVETYQARGWKATFLPLGTRSHRFTSAPSLYPNKVPISFVGSSIIGNALHLKREFAPALNPLQARIWEDFWTVQKEHPFEYLAPQFADALFKKDDSLTLTRLLQKLNINLTSVLAEWSGACHRIALVSATARFGIEVWGDAEWAPIARQVKGMMYMGPAGHQWKIPQIYAGSIINLDITRSYQPDVATLRLFDVLVGGNVCITNYDDSQYRLFEPPGLLTFHTLESLQVLCEEVLRWPAHVRKAYTSHMQAQTIQNHDLSQRVSKMRARK